MLGVLMVLGLRLRELGHPLRSCAMGRGQGNPRITDVAVLPLAIIGLSADFFILRR